MKTELSPASRHVNTYVARSGVSISIIQFEHTDGLVVHLVWGGGVSFLTIG